MENHAVTMVIYLRSVQVQPSLAQPPLRHFSVLKIISVVPFEKTSIDSRMSHQSLRWFALAD